MLGELYIVLKNLVDGQATFYIQDHEDEVQSTSWKQSGQLLTTQCKDRTLRILDPRQAKVAAACESHRGNKNSKVVWMGNSDRILTTGFSAVRKTVRSIWFFVFPMALVEAFPKSRPYLRIRTTG